MLGRRAVAFANYGPLFAQTLHYLLTIYLLFTYYLPVIYQPKPPNQLTNRHEKPTI